ncbi:uncharacterized protein KY384_005836 [Bacidia gigantensis]|uniref:uncharacterized protein n=1 Tax=Bacidia gigantensis TaxID=2732470 RepID=UPI001D03E918|nr:uncharacterized protein KY384_005836 [Bacidia gigantensis]KAG8529201.1 hypothetical protein KY384_005836 [Bacidia gigantensis]
MATDIRVSELKDPVDVAEYLFRRLYEVGVRGVHGVPGDYNLVALDYIPQHGLYWVGNCNELNAGYAADGYARVKGISAVVTTFGVGELSLLNAIAGGYSEYVPIVHIVGTPSTLSQKDGMLLHHTLGNGNFEVFADMSKNISCATAKLNDPHEAATLIDHAIREFEGERLRTPLDLDYPTNNEEKEDYVVDVVLKYLHAAKNPVILVDACAIRHRVLNEVHELVEKSGLPTYVAPMGKGAIDETLPNYGGVYAGNGSNAGVADRVESADLVLSIGAIKSDFNTAGFTYRVSQLKTIDFHSSIMRVRFSEYPGVRMQGVLKKVTAKMGKLSIQPGPSYDNIVPKKDQGVSTTEVITHDWLWPSVGQWLEPDDIVITETGTANFGIWETKFPKGVTALSQVLWGSIGWSVGACQGAALAAKESGSRRTVLFVGDGSFQLTAQEVSTMIRNDLKPIIFLICNNGYTIERYIHGMDANYNDIQEWRNKDLVDVFGATPQTAKTYQVRTKDEANALFKSKEFCAASVLQFVELYMPKEDAPKALQLTAKASAETNAKQ